MKKIIFIAGILISTAAIATESVLEIPAEKGMSTDRQILIGRYIKFTLNKFGCQTGDAESINLYAPPKKLYPFTVSSKTCRVVKSNEPCPNESETPLTELVDFFGDTQLLIENYKVCKPIESAPNPGRAAPKGDAKP